jgi:DNA polymerase IV
LDILRFFFACGVILSRNCGNMPKLAHFRAKHDAPESLTPDSSAAILHIDMDAFFVSVELLARPELRRLPVVVGGQRDQRGVVSSASYEARRFGIHSAMPLRTAAKLCPQAVFLDGHHELYSEWSDRVAAVLGKFSPVVEMASIDEAYLDLAGTERLLGPPLAAADRLLREITATTGLPCSGGLASTRLVAKVASEQAKPRGLVWVPAGSEAEFLAPLSVRRIPGIGRVTEEALRALRIETVSDLQRVPRERLEKDFGRWGTALFRKAHGGDSYEFFVDAEPKSLSHNQTFGEDTRDRAQLESTLSFLCQKAGKRLREAGLYARGVSLTLRYTDFKTITRSRTLAEPSDLDTIFLSAVRELFSRAWDGAAMLRLVGVELTMFSAAPGQMDLLDAARREKLERLARATDELCDRFGFSKLQFGGALEAPRDRAAKGAPASAGKPDAASWRSARNHPDEKIREANSAPPAKKRPAQRRLLEPEPD